MYIHICAHTYMYIHIYIHNGEMLLRTVCSSIRAQDPNSGSCWKPERLWWIFASSC